MTFMPINNYMNRLRDIETQPVVETTPNGTRLNYCPLTGSLILNIGGIAYFVANHGEEDEAIYCMGDDNVIWWHYTNSWFCFIDSNGQSFYTKGDGNIVNTLDTPH
jgi:hypothetical protein